MKQIILLIVFTVLFFQSHAQYENKLTFTAGIGYALPQGGDFNNDQRPNLFSNYNSGLEFSAGLQYNLDAILATGINVRYMRASDWDDPRTDEETEVFFQTRGSGNDIFNSVIISNYWTYKFWPTRILRPFIWAGWGVNIYSAERKATEGNMPYDFQASDEFVEINSVNVREPAEKLETGAAFTLFVGPGIDYRLSDNLSLQLIATYNTSFAQNKGGIGQNMNYISVMGGISVSVFRSKEL